MSVFSFFRQLSLQREILRAHYWNANTLKSLHRSNSSLKGLFHFPLPFNALCESYFVSHRVIVCVSLFFPHPSLSSFCPLSFARAPPLCLYVAEEQLSRAGHKVGQAVRLQAPQSSNTELIVSYTSSHTHSPVLLTHKPHAHIHLKARQEGVGSWTHISWVSIEVHQRELWHLKLEKAESEECNMWSISSATSQKMPFTVCARLRVCDAGWSNTFRPGQFGVKIKEISL